MEQKVKIVILGVIRNAAGEVLLTQRFEPILLEVHLKWELPGGTNEFGEAPELTVVREIAEETGLEIRVLRLLPLTHSKTWNYPQHAQHTLILGYECELVGGSVKCLDPKVAQAQWLPLHQAKQVDLLEGTEKFLNVLG